MRVGIIEGSNLTLIAPKNWDEERDGRCGDLAVLVKEERPFSMTSAWFPTPEEIELIGRGAPVHLEVFSGRHPPVMLTVGKVPA